MHATEVDMNPQVNRSEVDRTASTPYVVACVSMAAGAALGAAAMYLLDPSRGKVRRAQLADGAASKVRKTRQEAAAKAEDLYNRTRGLLARAGTLVRHEEPGDPLVAERVRSALGHLTRRRPGVESEVKDGTVTLRGTVPEPEKQKLLAGIGHVAGVKAVVDCLTSPHPV
jgi:hypothetical protein